MDGPQGFQEGGAFRFSENRHMKVTRFSALLNRPPLPTMKYNWYSFVLVEDSNKGPYCGWKGYVNAKLKNYVT